MPYSNLETGPYRSCLCLRLCETWQFTVKLTFYEGPDVMRGEGGILFRVEVNNNTKTKKVFLSFGLARVD